MKTRAVRMYGLDDLRLEEFELPEIQDDEILVKVMSDSICMSTYKLVKLGKSISAPPRTSIPTRLSSDTNLPVTSCRWEKSGRISLNRDRNFRSSRLSITRASWTRRDILMSSAAEPPHTASFLMR